MRAPADLLEFWFGDDLSAWRQERWFRPDPGFDAACAHRFEALLAPAREGALDGWAATPEGALALVLALDQFPRNLHRGAPAAFAADTHARAVARRRLGAPRRHPPLRPLPAPQRRARSRQHAGGEGLPRRAGGRVLNPRRTAALHWPQLRIPDT